MSEDEFEKLFDNYELEDSYAEYIMHNCHGDRLICNGDTLVDAMEDLYLYEDFKEAVIDGKIKITNNIKMIGN